MKFYQGDEYLEERLISLQSLIKRNDGLFKSEKQGNFIKGKWTVRDICEGHWIDTWIGTKEGCKYIIVDGYTEFGHGHGRGNVPVSYCYEIDNVGIVAKYRPRFQRFSGTGYAIKEMTCEWTCDRPIEPIVVEQQVKVEPVSTSEWIGEVDERRAFEGVCVFVKDFETQFGFSYVNKFVDDNGNEFVYFGSRCFDRDVRYSFNAKVKEHSEYNGRKQTVVQRPTKIKGGELQL